MSSPKASTATIHEATCVPGGVQRRPALTQPEAVARRRLGLDVVVCGDDTSANCLLAQSIEGSVGQSMHHGPHAGGGLFALPHWQQRVPPPDGHSFYETQATKTLP